MRFNLQFAGGTFVCDRWPEDLRQTVGRLVVSPWKSKYPLVSDHFDCGRIVRIVAEGNEPRIEFRSGKTGGTCTAPVSECFLIPVSAEGGA